MTMSWTAPARTPPMRIHKAPQITELGGNDRTDQRTGTGDGCEMMTEYDVFVRRNVVVTVFKTEGRRNFVLVQGQYLGGDESAVKTVCQYEYEGEK